MVILREIMENMVTLTNYTRQEFLAIVKRAKARKVEWQKKTVRELNEMSDKIINSKVRNQEIFG